MKYTLQELFDFFDAQTQTTAKFIKTEFNLLSGLGVDEMSDIEAEGIYIVLKNRLSKLLPANTIYTDPDNGISGIKCMLRYNLYPLVIEVRNMIKAMTKDIATTHSQSRFNPIDNDTIEEAPTAIDDTNFKYVENMLAQVDYLNNNSTTLDKIYSDFTTIVYILG